MKLDLQCQSSHWRPLSYASVSRCQSIPRTGLNNALNAFKAAKCANPRNARFNRMQNKVDHIHSSPLEVLHAGSIKVSIENLSSRCVHAGVRSIRRTQIEKASSLSPT